jgi:hypothetical protein
VEHQLTNELNSLKISKKNNFYKIINIFLIISAFLGLVLPWAILSRFQENVLNSATNLSDIAGYLKFLMVNKDQMIMNIAMHNFVISIICFILSFLSSGILGCFFLFLNSFSIGTVLFGVHDFWTVIFTSFLVKKRKIDDFSMKNIFKISIILIAIIATIYFAAAFIESDLILEKRS